ncbi:MULTISPECIES: hypothetical protein [Bacillaceae]|uniref:Uncharacterized protein n=1 Tax=Oceanobacillus caeni TaxID=405946 RepID=A0ABR5MMY1_9BACI|nr:MULTISPECIES: hypothetical protein [Bacillaceae]KPH78243.1 hypothetical protein AFL42_02295 [Oceanobacillus caeni]MED4474523.1 hypothetical protein [Oceanobacillus caeni]
MVSLNSIEIENNDLSLQDDLGKDISQEIEEYPELKESLTRYLDNSDMKRYTGSELRQKRYEKRI